ncbi:MAG: phosphate permease [Bacteroidales bacterium]|nr:phosphate permease [Bacteroidales bacterium]
MESIYLVIVGVLFVLAISDLVVGVSNDAVNFLNSAIGSKAASFKVIMLVAALGVVVGATFSSGMMEVARKGIFHPQMFYFSEIMIIFFAVMITDVILLDTFNTLGLPTSTTVSIVFELLGAAVAISLLKVMNDSGLSVADYINSSKALAIISGILLSVVVAFLSGAIIQYISRMIFSFRFKRKMKLYGSIWGGLSITAITYFILIKGLKGSSYAYYEIDGVILKEWVQLHAIEIIAFSLVAWTVLLQISTWLFKINISRVIVLVGTFALAMAFAGNDLVNFIGVPIAGYESYLQFMQDPSADPNAFMMTGLTKKVETNFYFLLIAGLVMVVTLYFNKKAKRVIKTSLDLSRQDEGTERFGATAFSKTLVRSAIRVNKKVSAFMPQAANEFIRKQFDNTRAEEEYTAEEKPAFDMIRASVNLVVASILISFATSLKLPLSTTYVTFMVAMGTSLADNAWGRESAVFRITGVISVIMGWFFTAMAAFTVAFIVAYLSQIGGIIVITIFIFLAGYAVIRSNFFGKKDQDLEAEELEASNKSTETIGVDDIYRECNLNSSDAFHLVADVFESMVVGLSHEKRKQLKHTVKKAKTYNKKVKLAKDNIKHVIERLDEESFNSAQYYTLVLDYMREIGHNVTFITEPALEHVDNNHKPIGEFQTLHLTEISDLLKTFSSVAVEIITENRYEKMDELLSIETTILSKMDEFIMAQIKRLRKKKSGAKNTKLFLDILAETKTLTFNMINLVKSQRDLSKLAGHYRD